MSPINDNDILNVVEERLFSATMKTEAHLLQIDAKSRNLAVGLWLHIPTEESQTQLDLLTIGGLLQSQGTEDDGSTQLADIYAQSSQKYSEKIYDAQIRTCLNEFGSGGGGGDYRKNYQEFPLEPLLKLDYCVGTFEEDILSGLLRALQKVEISSDAETSTSKVAITSATCHTLPQRIAETENKFTQTDPTKPIRTITPVKDVISLDIDDKAELPRAVDLQASKRQRVQSEQQRSPATESSEDVQILAKDFKTAKQVFVSNAGRKNNQSNPNMGPKRNAVNLENADNSASAQLPRKTLGTQRRRVVQPSASNKRPNDGDGSSGVAGTISRKVFKRDNEQSGKRDDDNGNEEIDERLKNIDPKMVETIQNEIMDASFNISWDDIAGLQHAKQSIQEVVIWPMQRPDIFTGLRRAPKGILLFGPPGTGKTMIGKCIASNAGCTFFSISASSLTSKWVGEGEKMVRALFAVARVHQPSVIFIDEIDSLLTQRTDGEFEASRRIKTEFLIQFDGAHVSKDDDQILVIGATNRPQEIDEAARRRLIKRYYIPLPDSEARQSIVKTLLKKQVNSISDEEIEKIGTMAKGYSGSDMDGLCREAALGPIREIPPDQICNISLDSVRPILYRDFEYALTQVRASVSTRDLELYLDWNKNYGSLPDITE